MVDGDGNKSLVPAISTVTVVGLPAATSPTVLTSVINVFYTAGSSGIPVDSGLIVLDADSATMTGATVTITVDPAVSVLDHDSIDMIGATVTINGGLTTGDVLTFTPPDGSLITGDYDSVTGTLTLSGAGTLEQYQEALRSVTYASSGALLASVKGIAFAVTDAEGATSVPGLVTLTVVANTPPLLTTASTRPYFGRSDSHRADSFKPVCAR